MTVNIGVRCKSLTSNHEKGSGGPEKGCFFMFSFDHLKIFGICKKKKRKYCNLSMFYYFDEKVKPSS